MKKIEKGTLGYIDNQKSKLLFKTTILFLLVLVIFIAGFILNHNSKSNYFSILAVLMVLPASKALVLYIVLFPYKSVTKTRYDDIIKRANGSILFTDMVLASKERTMHLDFLIIRENELLGFSGGKIDDSISTQKYLVEGLRARNLPFEIEIVKEEADFLSKLLKLQSVDVKKDIENKENKESKDFKELQAYLKSLLI